MVITRVVYASEYHFERQMSQNSADDGSSHNVNRMVPSIENLACSNDHREKPRQNEHDELPMRDPPAISVCSGPKGFVFGVQVQSQIPKPGERNSRMPRWKRHLYFSHSRRTAGANLGNGVVRWENGRENLRLADSEEVWAKTTVDPFDDRHNKSSRCKRIAESQELYLVSAKHF
jgi:hypothetical protein